MADKTKRWDDNVEGSYYVDKDCIFCALCHEIAPDNFMESADGTHDKVYKQPSNEEEKALCEEALENCPVEAIGRDGD